MSRQQFEVDHSQTIALVPLALGSEMTKSFQMSVDKQVAPLGDA